MDIGREKTIIDTHISISLGNYLEPFPTQSYLTMQGLLQIPPTGRNQLVLYIPRRSIQINNEITISLLKLE